MNSKITGTFDFNIDGHGGNIEAAKNRFGERGFLDLSININPWGPPLQFWFTFLINLSKLREYPQPYTIGGQAILARFFGLEPEWIVLGNGAAELIRHLPRVLPVNRAVILEPTFSEYKHSFMAAGKPVEKMALEPGSRIPRETLKTVLQAGDLLFICQPNNPTGGLFREGELAEILALAAVKGSWVAIDESFLWFAGDIKKLSFYRYLREYPKLIIINSLTKIGSIPGLRLGFVIARPETAKLIQDSLDQWSVNRLAQAIIGTVIEPKFLRKTLRRLKKENFWLRKQFSTVTGLKVFPWDANFYLVKSKMPNLSARDIIRKLGKEGVLVRDCSNFESLGSDYIRVAVGNHSQNKLFLNKLRRILKI